MDNKPLTKEEIMKLLKGMVRRRLMLRGAEWFEIDEEQVQAVAEKVYSEYPTKIADLT